MTTPSSHQVSKSKTASFWGFELPHHVHRSLMPRWLFSSPFLRMTLTKWRDKYHITGGPTFSPDQFEAAISCVLWPSIQGASSLRTKGITTSLNVLERADRGEPTISAPIASVAGSRLDAALLFSSRDDGKRDAARLGYSKGYLSRLRNGKFVADKKFYAAAEKATHHDADWLCGFDRIPGKSTVLDCHLFINRLSQLRSSVITAVLNLEEELPQGFHNAPAWLDPFLVAAALNPVHVEWIKAIEQHRHREGTLNIPPVIGPAFAGPTWAFKTSGPPPVVESEYQHRRGRPLSENENLKSCSRITSARRAPLLPGS